MKGVDKLVDIVDCLPRRNFTPLVGSRPRPLLIGIDPGLSGAVVVVDCDRRQLVDVMDLPTFQKKTTARKSGFFGHLDIHMLSTMIDLYAPLTALAVLEEPGAMPEQGLSSTFRFGHICGQIHGVLAGHYIPVAPVKPSVWKSALALSANKDESRDMATKAFPQGAGFWSKKKHNDRAEAALLTVYAEKYLKKIIQLSRGTDNK